MYPCELGRSSDSFLPPSQCQTRVLSLSFLAGAGDLRGARCPQPSQSYNSYNKNTLPPVPRGLLLHLPVMYSLQRPHSGNTWKRFIVPVRGNVVCVHINSREREKERNDILRRLCKLPCFCLYICRVLFLFFVNLNFCYAANNDRLECSSALGCSDPSDFPAVEKHHGANVCMR